MIGGSVVTDPSDQPISMDDVRLSDEYLATLANFKVGDVVTIDDPNDLYYSRHALIIDKLGFTIWVLAKPIISHPPGSPPKEIYFNKQTFSDYSSLSVSLNHKDFCCFKYDDKYFYNKFIILQRPPTILKYYDRKDHVDLFSKIVLDDSIIITTEDENDFYQRISKLGKLGKLSDTVVVSLENHIDTDIEIDFESEKLFAIAEIDFSISDTIKEKGPAEPKVGRPKKPIEPTPSEETTSTASRPSMPKMRSGKKVRTVFRNSSDSNTNDSTDSGTYKSNGSGSIGGGFNIMLDQSRDDSTPPMNHMRVLFSPPPN